MKIVGFAQLRNELAKGNLVNWFKSMSVCDYIYIYDQNSDDGSKDYYKKFDNVVVIESPLNDFSNEIKCKAILLERLLCDHPDTDWIFWLDGDTILDKALSQNNQFINLCQVGLQDNVDGFTFGHYNLWRSDVHYRVDNKYDWLHNTGVVALWRNNGRLIFPKTTGLHTTQYPQGITHKLRVPYNLIHRGFATDDQIILKYNIYKNRGQSGWALDRLIDETTLKVEEISRDVLPDWYEVKDIISPINKKKICELL